MRPRVLVSLVTYNSSVYLAACLQSLKEQSYPDLIACLWDNASSDQTEEIVSRYFDFLHTTHFSRRNVGFCAAHNRVIGSVNSDYVLVLNPDVVLDSRYIEVLVDALNKDMAAGSATGKLWRWQMEPVSPPVRDSMVSLDFTRQDRAQGERPAPAKKVIDTTGIYFLPNQRHLDRGSGELDVGQYETCEYVFGASGAAAFYRRSMLQEIKVGDEYFDEAFFSYREDADLAWRAQWLGWRCLYVPEAKGFHVRRVLPERRSSLPADINMHSFKNRFLMRVKNMDAETYARFFIPIASRDLASLAYVLVREWSSLRAIPLILRALPRAWEVRRAVRRHRRVSPKEIRSWFSYKPVAKPAPVILHP